SVVTAMSRNGVDFAIRVSGLGERWFTAPVEQPLGLYFSGYSPADGNPDIGDSSITETIGVGGMAMAAAPAVVAYLGAGSFADPDDGLPRSADRHRRPRRGGNRHHANHQHRHRPPRGRPRPDRRRHRPRPARLLRSRTARARRTHVILNAVKDHTGGGADPVW